MKIQHIAQLGALVGLYEAIAIVRWDWLMNDPRDWRVALAMGHVLVIIALNTGLFAVLGSLCRRCPVLTSLVYTVCPCRTTF